MKRQILSLAVILSAVCLSASAKRLNLTDLDETLINETVFSDLYNKSVEWGLYKPDLYFGIKNRQQMPLSIGMFWYYTKPSDQSLAVNYIYNQDQGVVAHYEFCDLSSASRQILNDSTNNMVFTTEFYKELEENDTTPGQYISRWSAKVTIKKLNSNAGMTGTPVFFISKEGNLSSEDGYFTVSQNGSKNFYKAQQKVGENLYESIEIGSDQQIDDKSMVGLQTDADRAWQLHNIWSDNYEELKSASGFINTTTPNVLMFKPKETVDGFTLFIRYSKRNFTTKEEADAYSEVMQLKYTDVIKEFDESMVTVEGAFDSKLLRVFGEQGFKDFESSLTDIRKFGKEALSNLLGGIGYFYGAIRIKNNTDDTWYYDNSTGLFTGTPSRSKYPRGFLWDEGLHSMLTCQWQLMMCMDIITHWLNTIKESGWIPREQMRGSEAEAAVPDGLVEDEKEGNPPSFIFVLQHLLEKTSSQRDERIIAFFQNVFPRIELWFNFFNTTMINQISSDFDGTYMWKDTIQSGSKSSGFDDYPRGFRQTFKAMIHTDLMSWMFTFSRFMKKSIEYLEEIAGDKPISTRPSSDYWILSNKIIDQTYKLCWDENSGLLTDRMIYESTASSLANTKLLARELESNIAELEFLKELQMDIPDKYMELSTATRNQYSGVSDFSGHKGIVNLYPVAFGIFNDYTLLDNTLRFAADTGEMFSPFGLRGLSKRDESYKPDSGSWTGPIWVSSNYLVLRGVYKYYIDYVPEFPLRDDKAMVTARDFYTQLRKNIVTVVYDNWTQEHLIYQNYHDSTGKGQNAHPFTGWSAMILLAITEKYI